MGIELTEIIDKIVRAGILGVQACELKSNELEMLCNLDFVETFDFSAIEILQKNFHDNKHNPQHLSSQIIHDMDFLKSSLVRVNTYTWKQILLGNKFRFQKNEICEVLNELVLDNDFKQESYLCKKYKVQRKCWSSFYANLLKYDIIDTKFINSEVFLKLKSSDGKIILHGRGNTKKSPEPLKSISKTSAFLFDPEIPIYLQIQSKIYSENGTSSSELLEDFKIKTKLGLKMLETLKYQDTRILSKDCSSGKVTMYIFHVPPDQKTKSDILQSNFNKKWMARENKLSLLKEFANKQLCFINNIENRKKYAKILNNGYVPDKKHLDKLAKEAGLFVTKTYKNTNSSSTTYIALDKITFDSVYKNNEHSTEKQVKKFRDLKKKLYSKLVMPKEFVALDNGYLQDPKERFVVFADLLQRKQYGTYYSLDQAFILQINLKSMFKLFSYPYLPKIMKRAEGYTNKKNYIVETKHFQYENCPNISFELSFADLQKLDFSNIEFTFIRQLYSMKNFENMLREFSFLGLLSFSLSNSIFQILLENQTLSTTKRVKSTAVPYIDLAFRKNFFQMLADETQLELDHSVFDLVENHFYGEKRDALMFILNKYFRSLLKADPSKKSLGAANNGDSNLRDPEIQAAYAKMKDIIIQNGSLSLCEISVEEKYAFKKAIRIGQNEKVFKVSKTSKTVHFRSKISNMLKNSEMKTFIACRFFISSDWNLADQERGFIDEGARIIYKNLMNCGSQQLSDLSSALKFMSIHDLHEMAAKYHRIFEIKDMHGCEILKLRGKIFYF